MIKTLVVTLLLAGTLLPVHSQELEGFDLVKDAYRSSDGESFRFTYRFDKDAMDFSHARRAAFARRKTT